MLEKYDRLCENVAYRKDLMEAARQAISNLSWYFVEKLRLAYNEKNLDAVSYYGAELLSLYDIQVAIVSTDETMLLGRWLEKAKRLGRTAAEKAYFEWNARTQITLWSHREGSKMLRDYAAREWQGILEDFYRPRWESFISRLEISLLTDNPLDVINYYDEELPFTYQKKAYPTASFGNLRTAVEVALAKIRATKITHRVDTEKQASFEENVMNDVAK
jgi:alpha-N-acetylglucosaminidase